MYNLDDAQMFCICYNRYIATVYYTKKHYLQSRAEHGGAIGVGDLKCLNTDNFPWEKPHWRHGKRLFGVSWGELWNRWKRLYNCYVMFGSWKPKATSVHHQSFGASLGHSKTVLDSSEKQRDEQKMSQHVATRVAWICVWCILQFFGHRPASTFQGGWCSAYRKRHVAVLVQEICVIKLILKCIECSECSVFVVADWTWHSKDLETSSATGHDFDVWIVREGHGSKNSPRDPRRFLLPSTETLFVTFGYVRLEECEECCTMHHFGKY